MPPECSPGQVTTKNHISNMDEYLASEYFTNTFGSPGPSDLLEADLSMDCQPSLEMNLDYLPRCQHRTAEGGDKWALDPS
ncbi:hypothetical protein FOXG_19727 [Fusarium oxysporum f. sp. lycopersici 4287]|uniref:Uncharacterized protein n=2 Tax=Fusarium oxysporum TaxID=5507 RepID=A0A0J9WLV7_FUSO4|nr:hypothetical protein FOXG_19299 [Fusarium oxysporum f. sp. lycopersici 4287]XP_018242498.1 hypothetical protein FOXG_19299 [Fusarium oxysporum f. sp. lycopersici 4287]XP_018242697.1 hypothetical protein FOXG_19361 [Fusarium oxysporum f. sp. lycopersici 4287]XP_018244632.1 hypothetical protein FOXG_19727 [Fusarium oxysporum f. sp. lycopersici 4287]EXK23202.1 hypothetical protein FOMG_20017 [Fusarium oxysporum f. sp. melonis 26406]EXK23203.1 hypothetical protein FOMG_20017 [Fusarium oxysporum